MHHRDDGAPAWSAADAVAPGVVGARVAARSASLRGPRFDRPIPHGGYCWHYVDGVSDDGQSAIVVIALLGNPFSPAYARARGRSPGSSSALHFSSMNVALYARGASAWSLHERRVEGGDRAAARLAIGHNAMRWDGDRLVVEIDERTTPLGRPLRGKVLLHPEVETRLELAIDARGEHRWWPVAPMARIEVDFPSHGLRFSGHGYHDANAGDVPLESTFETWSWSRARAPDGALLTYDLELASGARRALAFKVSKGGETCDLPRVWSAPLPRTAWGLERRARADAGHEGRVVRSLEDGPFYARALVATQLDGRPVTAMHETLAAHRLRRTWVRALTGFRMRQSP